MKAISEKGTRVSGDFYASTLAPVAQRSGIRFSAVDFVMLSVLFLEMIVLMRLFLAK